MSVAAFPGEMLSARSRLKAPSTLLNWVGVRVVIIIIIIIIIIMGTGIGQVGALAYHGNMDAAAYQSPG